MSWGDAISCHQCGMAASNSIHRKVAQFGYHEYVEPPKPEPTALEEARDLFDNPRHLPMGTAEIERVLGKILEHLEGR